ncbi:MAG TPA: HAD family hydrolase [Candidatus Ozemobacteraceae bacterium]|nr:HAD family hydrolase [Candidatus Ozemobacteraceae bacterium]
MKRTRHASPAPQDVAAALLVLFLLAGFVPVSALERVSARLAASYPHWGSGRIAELVLIDRFIERHAGRGAVAVFDFDGTIISEEWPEAGGTRRSGQSAWRIWCARHLNEVPFVFPRLDLGFGSENHRDTILRLDAILEGQTRVEAAGWLKFTGLTSFEAGMTPDDVRRAVEAFLSEQPPAGKVFFPMLDIMQRMIDRGWHVWIVSGSSPHFITAVLEHVARTCEYTPGRRYDFRGILAGAWNPCTAGTPAGARLLGNTSKLDATGRFSLVYDDAFTQNPANEPFVLEKEGKRIALESWIEPAERKRAMFCAGNSDGDAVLMEFITGRASDTLGLFVNPRGKAFQALLGKRQSVQLEMHPAVDR